MSQVWLITVFVFLCKVKHWLLSYMWQQVADRWKLTLCTQRGWGCTQNNAFSLGPLHPGPERSWDTAKRSSRWILKWLLVRKRLKKLDLGYNKNFVASKTNVFKPTILALRIVLCHVCSKVSLEEINSRSFWKILQGKTVNIFLFR